MNDSDSISSRLTSEEMRIAKLNSRIKYKPNYRVNIMVLPGSDSYGISINAPVIDTYSGKSVNVRTVGKLGSKEELNRLSDMELLKLVRAELHKWEIHEADEWLTLDGDRPFDPHKKSL